MEELKQENKENRSFVFGRMMFCISSLKLNFNFSSQFAFKANLEGSG